jgi:magnesium chelatase subunit I
MDMPDNLEDLPTEANHPMNASPDNKPRVNSLKELIDLVTGRNWSPGTSQEPLGLAEILPFPFLAMVGQFEMRLALLLAVINPAVSGVLLVGPRGTGKTTAVRSLSDLLPEVQRSTCFYGCLPEDIETGGIDAVCPDCAKKYGEGKPLTVTDHVKLVELPLNSRLEDVIGGMDDRALIHERLRLKRGILAQADRNLLYMDEVNLLADEITDATLDAAAQGHYTVRRGAMSATYNARFALIASMNPEEGNLRPQIMDRFGLRVVVRGLQDSDERLEAYNRVRAYLTNPQDLVSRYLSSTLIAREETQQARSLLSKVEIPEDVAKSGIELIQKLKIDSLRAEITLFEAARSYAAADARLEVSLDDIRIVAPMSLRMRRSSFMVNYFDQRQSEEDEIYSSLQQLHKQPK